MRTKRILMRGSAFHAPETLYKYLLDLLAIGVLPHVASLQTAESVAGLILDLATIGLSSRIVRSSGWKPSDPPRIGRQ